MREVPAHRPSLLRRDVRTETLSTPRTPRLGRRGVPRGAGALGADAAPRSKVRPAPARPLTVLVPVPPSPPLAFAWRGNA